MAKRRRRSKKDSVGEAVAGLVIMSAIAVYLLTKSAVVAVITLVIVIGIFKSIRLIIDKQREVRLRKSGIYDIDKMDGRQFELYLDLLYKALGYKTEVTRFTGDFGADLVIEKKGVRTVVQAKCYAKNVGIDAVQQVQASKAHYKAAQALVVTNSKFTEAAKTLAHSNGVNLVDRESLIEMILAINPGQKPSTKEVAATKDLGLDQKSSLTVKTSEAVQVSKNPKIESTRIGQLGEHKINIQLDQLPKDCYYLSDLMVRNNKSRSGYSQIDHIIISPYGLFVIETKNYNGEIKGERTEKSWTVNNRFKMYNPLMQNHGHIKALENLLKSYPSILFISIVSFTMRCRFAIDPELRKIESNELIVYDVELSEFITRKINRLRVTGSKQMLSELDMKNIERSLQEANITDPTLRAVHVAALKKRSTNS